MNYLLSALTLLLLLSSYTYTIALQPAGSAPLQASASALVSAPQSLDELVSKAPLIFIGEVGPVAQHLEHAIYGEDGQLLKPTADLPLPPVPATDFALEVEQVIRDDGAIAAGKTIILRMPGTATAGMKMLTLVSEYPFSYTGDRHLFLLSPNPDGESYGFYYAAWSRLLIDGDILRVSNGQLQPLLFEGSDQPITLEEFIEAVEGSP